MLTCMPVLVELLYSAQRPDDFHYMRREYGTLTTCPIGQPEWDRAVEIYGLLADRGPLHQRQVGQQRQRPVRGAEHGEDAGENDQGAGSKERRIALQVANHAGVGDAVVAQ